jgi:hypothetical protein
MLHWRSDWAAAWAIVLLTAALPSPVLHAFEFVSSAEVADRCRAYLQDVDSEDGRYCAAYVRGFIDGSALVVLKADPDSTESFAQRAARTRLGRPLIVRPEYCIDASLGMTQLVQQIVAVADERPPREDVDAAVLLYATFDRYHKCE